MPARRIAPDCRAPGDVVRRAHSDQGHVDQFVGQHELDQRVGVVECFSRIGHRDPALEDAEVAVRMVMVNSPLSRAANRLRTGGLVHRVLQQEIVGDLHGSKPPDSISA